ncbi:MAG: ABC transporter substrate-binding protein [Nitrospirota bacterium]|nr:ABC transporter substrate-binding protein [Nitrospirota bacterium]
MKKSILSLALVTLIAGISLACFPLCSDAGEPTEQVKETVDAVVKILNNEELKKPEKEKERRAIIRQTIAKRFDFEEMAKRSLSSYWKERTPAEQKEFVTLYSDLLENTYIRKIERYENEKVVYYDERLDGDYAVVRTKIVDKNRLSIPVEYRILRKKDRWEVYDIIVEGISLVNNYRTQFTQIIRSDSYDALVKRLREKVNK